MYAYSFLFVFIYIGRPGKSTTIFHPSKFRLFQEKLFRSWLWVHGWYFVRRPLYIYTYMYIYMYIYTHTYGQHLMWNMDFFPIISGHTRTITVSERKRYLSGVVSHYLRIFSPDLKWQIENGPWIPFQGVYGLIISRERKMFTCHGKLPRTVLLYHICLDVILFL